MLFKNGCISKEKRSLEDITAEENKQKGNSSPTPSSDSKNQRDKDMNKNSQDRSGR